MYLFPPLAQAINTHTLSDSTGYAYSDTVHRSFMTTSVSQPAEDRKQLPFSHYPLSKQGHWTVQQQPAHPHFLAIFTRANS